MSSTGDVTLPASRRRSRPSDSGLSPARNKGQGQGQNATVDLGTTTLAANRKKSRSKSVGPGGLDALKPGHGNRRSSLAGPIRPPPRSILKPTMPLPEIPPHKSQRPQHNGPASSNPAIFGPQTASTPSGRDDPFDSGTKIALRSEEEQQAAAREREERERAALAKEIKDRRDARRKSLANRRVSFAAEATLHTFHEVEYMQDAAGSAEAARRAQQQANSDDPSSSPFKDGPDDNNDHQRGESSRRSSGVGASAVDSDDDDGDYSDDSDHGDDIVEEIEETSDADSSNQGSDDDDDGTVMTMDAEEVTSASFGTAANGSDVGGEAEPEPESSSGLDQNLKLAAERAGEQNKEPELDEDEELIPAFAGWGKKSGGQSSAAPAQNPNPQAANASLDQNDDATMDMDMTQPIGGIVETSQGPRPPNRSDQAKDTPGKPTRSPRGVADQPGSDDPNEDMSMDITNVLGGILNNQNHRASIRSTQAAGNTGNDGEATMEMTTALGQIQPGKNNNHNASTSRRSSVATEGNEDMSMELTAVMGGVLPSATPAKATRRKSLKSAQALPQEDDEDATMDMTMTIGRILPNQEDTMALDMTTPLGGIISEASPNVSASAQRPPTTTTTGQQRQLPGTPTKNPSVPYRSSPKRPSSAQTKPASATENDTMGLSAFQGTGIRRSPPGQDADTPQSSPFKDATPSPKGPTTATQTAAQTAAQTSGTPTRTPQRFRPAATAAAAARSPSVQHSFQLSSPARSSPLRRSPQRSIPQPRASLRSAASPARSTPKSAGTQARKSNSLFLPNSAGGGTTPKFTLTPQQRKWSGVGADKPGLGSPKVSEILDRRESIGEASEEFAPAPTPDGRRKVAFQDPRVMETEIDKDRQREADKENRRSILEREANSHDGGQDGTFNLKEMIQGLSPKKNPLKGRKSLHVGSARGLLGKRPTELDGDEEEEEDNDGVKRLKGLQGSPVKNVHLQQPPSKAETTGRLNFGASLTARNDINNNTTPTRKTSPTRAGQSTTPKDQPRFRNVPESSPPSMNMNDPAPVDEDAAAEDDGEKIHLQDFLNMTSIRFMELTTTKRRHTIAPPRPRSSTAEDDKDVSLESCVVAGACTVPLLELFQHSCRELKKYISEGRRIVKEIEMETFEENPPLFREYMTASPDFKMLMDNQFKNVKTHARLLSKAMWYEWRMKLQEGLQQGLSTNAEGMDHDDKVLRKRQDLLASVLPALEEKFEKLVQEELDLESTVRELADCDPQELEEARTELRTETADIAEKQRLIDELRKDVQESDTLIGGLNKQKQHCLEEIKEAEKIREECRGWSTTEIRVLRARVEALERQHGWAITKIAGTIITMTYLGEIELVFDMTLFKSGSTPASPVDLRYIGDDSPADMKPTPLTPEKDFFLGAIRNCARALPQDPTRRPSQLLNMVRGGWDQARAVANQVRLLNATFPTRTTTGSVASGSDSSLTAVQTTILLAPIKTKVEITLTLRDLSRAEPRSGGPCVNVDITTDARVIYGEHFNEPKMRDFVASRVGGAVGSRCGGESQSQNQNVNSAWSDAAVELYGKLLARGKKM